MHFTAIIGDYTFSRSLAETSTFIEKKFKGEVKLDYYFCLRHQKFPQEQLEKIEKSVKEADTVIVNMVFDDEIIDILERNRTENKNYIVLASMPRGVALTKLGKFQLPKLSMDKKDSMLAKAVGILRGLMNSSKSTMEVRKLLVMANTILKVLRFGKWKDAGNYIRAWKYFFAGGRDNITNLFLFILAEYYGYKVDYKEPEEIPQGAIYHPKSDKVFATVDEYLKWYTKSGLIKKTELTSKVKNPYVGILFYTQRYQTQDTADLEAVIETLEKRGLGAITILTSGSENMKNMERHFLSNGKSIVEAIISFLFFRIEGGPLGGDYEAFINLASKINVPIIKYLNMGYTTIEEWKEKNEGMAPLETTITAILPELDGLIEGVLISGHKDLSEDGKTIRIMQPIEDRVEKAVERTINWVKLRNLKNNEKKLAFVLFNYPPGKDNIGNAGNLDTFESLIRLFDRMKKEGYDVSGYPKTRQEFVRLMVKKNIVNLSHWTSLQKIKENAFKIPVSKYLEWFNELPEINRKEIIEQWGEPPGKILADDEYILIPGITFGKIFVGFQPPRGYFEDPSKTYHDTGIVPHHQYLAYYLWLQKEYQADLLIHFGTHGTLEFLPGKQVALSENCYPDILIGNVPHAYYYTCSNPSESSIARRRSHATTVDYMTPPMIVSNLYGRLLEIETEIHNYFQQKEQSPAQAKSIKEKILEMAKEENLIDIEAEDVDVSSLYDSLNEMKGTLMTKGVHVLGNSFKGDELIDYVMGIVRFDKGETRSLLRLTAESEGIDWEEARNKPSKIGNDGRPLGVVLEEIEDKGRKILSDYLNSKSPSAKKIVKKVLKTKISSQYLKEFEKTLKFAKEIASNLSNNFEIESLLATFSGKYIKPGVGGDPVRSPSVIPTGRNIYQFNPDLIPTRIAFERGNLIGKQVIEQYKTENNGKLPETIGVILWGFETMKTQGETVCEIFHYLGVEPRWAGNGEFIGVKPIPLDKLGRPRLDVAVEICGIFRDTFPVLLKIIDRAFNLVADLDEPHSKNFVKKHSDEIRKVLVDKGVPKSEADALSRARIFGPSATNYGTDVTQLIETAEWEESDEIANLHIAKMSHIYGDSYYAVSNTDTFREVLDKVDVVAQVRSSDEYGMADLDHYYEFLGGMAKSVENVKRRSGKKAKSKPTVLVADTTKDRISTKNIKSTLEYEAKTKLFNPKWIEGQISSGYRGVKNISKRVEHLVGWSATAESVDNWVWSQVAEKYLFDEKVRKSMMKENIWAVEHQLNRLMEAFNRGIWDATEEEIEKLKKIYLEIESEIEEQEE
ncbi:MAG: magnesium chelatase subunit H [Candidatus Schekmanbacteria bacterium]|nr:MAG: magnesium chelatase subunit H [Candidatus Schekmanbacteria bacterium]